MKFISGRCMFCDKEYTECICPPTPGNEEMELTVKGSQSIKQAVRASDMTEMIYFFKEYLRREEKDGEEQAGKYYRRFLEFIEDYNIDLDDLRS